MAQTPEGKVKVWLRTQMMKFYPDCWHYAPPGGPFGKIGIHDDEWLIKAGDFSVFVAIESKDVGKSPTPPQMKNLLHVKACGGIAAVMVGKDMNKLLKIKAEIDTRIKLLTYLSERIPTDVDGA